MIRQIADRLRRSPATVKAYFYDPTGDARGARKQRTGIERSARTRLEGGLRRLRDNVRRAPSYPHRVKPTGDGGRRDHCGSENRSG
jgi:hypothetical protein